MQKKSKLHLKYDSPVTLTFVLLSTLILALDSFALKGFLTTNIFICHGSKAVGNIAAFDYKNFLDYLRLFTHTLGSSGWQSLLANSTFILLLGPTLEERYGSPILLLMIVLTSLVGGVLNACLVPFFTSGSQSIVFMMICLAAITAFSKKEVPLSWIIVFALYFALKLCSSYSDFSNSNSASFSFSSTSGGKKIDFIEFLTLNLNTFTSLAAGIVGSLFGFLVSPKKRNSSENSKTSSKNSSAKTQKFNSKQKSSGTYDDDFGGSSSSSGGKPSSSSDETIIGSIDL